VRLCSFRASLLGLACSFAFGQEPARDSRMDGIRAEIAQLNRTIADQDRRIADLEKTPIGQLKATVADQGRRIAELEKSPIGQLNSTIADQARRIASLEKTVRVLQPGAGPAPKPDWHAALNWALIRNGMSEKQVVDLLGPPTRVQSVVDVRTLYYQPDQKSLSVLHGSVTLRDDRVTASDAPDF
jgi:hypothetical protein